MSGSQPFRRVVGISACAYLILVAVMWCPYNLESGMPYETAFPYHSETSSVWEGFLYRADLLRIHTNTFYHLAYLLSQALGIAGSFLPYQILYALLWWARGFLVFLILSRFLPHFPWFCYLVGSLVLVHSSDGALLWVGQMNQFGFIFWLVLATYFFVLAFQAGTTSRTLVYLCLAGLFQHMSLWSYESQIFIIVVVPLTLFLLSPRRWPRIAATALCWYVMPGVYIGLSALRYLRSSGQGYQESVLRSDWSLWSLLGDWTFNISASLKFWSWPRFVIQNASMETEVVLGLLAAVGFVAGGICIMRGHVLEPETVRKLRKTFLVLIGTGLVLVALSFPAYLLLTSARGLWRTQFLSGIGAAVVLSSLVMLISGFLRGGTAVKVASLGLGAIIVFFGSVSAIEKGALHWVFWEQHRKAVAGIVSAAPSVKPDTIVVLTNVPNNSDPFRHNMWLDLALRLSYPEIPVAGIYFYKDGTPSPGSNLKLDRATWKWDHTSFPPAVRESHVRNTLVLSYTDGGRARLQAELPHVLQPSESAVRAYQPRNVISGSRPSERALRRYGPLPE